MCHHGYSLAPNGRHCEGMNEKFLFNVSKYLNMLNKERNLCLSFHPFFNSFITISRISNARHRYIEQIKMSYVLCRTKTEISKRFNERVLGENGARNLLKAEPALKTWKQLFNIHAFLLFA